MSEVAMGVTVLTRVDRLGGLLTSANNKPIETAYIADHGDMTPKKEELYNQEYTFNLEILDLEENESLGYSRNQIVDASDEEYLLIVDSDHELPNNMMVLADQLDKRPEIGGIAGSIIEPDEGELWQSAKDFYEFDDVLVRDAHVEEKEVEYIAGSPFMMWDFIPNAAMFRRTCLEERAWDSDCPFGRGHADFYVGHWKHTSWVFGTSPEVIFRHYPGGDANYVSNPRGTDKYERAVKYFLDKWGYKDFQMGQPYWYATPRETPTLLNRARRVYNEDGVKTLLKRGAAWGSRTVRREFF